MQANQASPLRCFGLAFLGKIGMPITRSAKKALRQSLKRRAQNLKKSGALKKLARDVRKLAEQKKKAEAQKLLPALYKALDKAAKTGVIKKNAASRKKSRLTKLVNSL
ncbi:MAG: 30S ribosomal protein S20 [Parcubacteria group bacterium GW2011_GWA2_42_14]|nr:MAG: 30S ribosomal protein S20 [Parcubacteria group bacterium GW2011_GWA2_42_14]